LCGDLFILKENCIDWLNFAGGKINNCFREIPQQKLNNRVSLPIKINSSTNKSDPNSHSTTNLILCSIALVITVADEADEYDDGTLF
jgi:hypothetical protein